jgi:branched-chain amino acid transport system permease protein
MTLALQALVNGVVLGALYGLFALSIVVLYRTTSVVNFAQGNMSMFLAFVALFALIPTGMPIVVTFVLAILVGVLAGALIYGVVMRPRPSNDHYNELFRTMGLSLLLFAVAKATWGPSEPYTFPSLVEGGFEVFGFRVQFVQALTLVIALVLAGIFALFLRTPRIGLMMRAVSLDKEVSTLLGIRVRMVELAAWMIAGGLGAAIGILFAPQYSLSSEMMEPFLLKGFAAALLGGLTSFRGAIVAGLAIGVIDALVAVFLGQEWRDMASFVVILGVLLLRPAGLFGTARIVRV